VCFVVHSPNSADQMSEAGRLRVRTRVTTVTRLEATVSRRSTPANSTAARFSNPRPQLELRLRSLNRNNGVDRRVRVTSVFEPYTAIPAPQDPPVHDRMVKMFAAYVVVFSRLKLFAIARRSRWTLAEATSNVEELFLQARKARKDQHLSV
jgi:hypothetical protein